jgi:hypothetical protein
MPDTHATHALCVTNLLLLLLQEVLALSRALAVRMLQIELEYAFGSLEDEAMDIGSDVAGACTCSNP